MLRSSLASAIYLLPIVSIFVFTGCAMISPMAKVDYTVETAGMDFVYVKGGTFQMGSTDRPHEQPVHNVTIQKLFVGMYEVTFEQYDQYCVTNPRCEQPPDENWGRGDRPVINVSWDDAIAYAAWLSKQTGLQFRLPTEAEWEYFARAGTTTKFWAGDAIPKGSANCSGCGSKWDDKMTAPVGSFAPNPWGIYDTAGNVTEWVLDHFQRNYKNAPADGSPVIILNFDRNGQRGGAWNSPVRYLESAARDNRRKDSATKDNGFRLVLVPDGSVPLPIVQ